MSKLKQSLKITIKAETFADKMNARLEDLRKNAKLPGFRPGQAPLSMIRQKYENSVKGEVLDDLINEQVASTLTEPLGFARCFETSLSEAQKTVVFEFL